MIPNLTPEEIERLALLSEEMGEAQQVIGKILRHGYESCHPDGGPRNRQLLEKEIGDVRAAISLMIRKNDIYAPALWRHESNKEQSVKPYLHHKG